MSYDVEVEFNSPEKEAVISKFPSAECIMYPDMGPGVYQVMINDEHTNYGGNTEDEAWGRAYNSLIVKGEKVRRASVAFLSELDY